MSTTRTQFTFRVDTWTPDGESIVEQRFCVALRWFSSTLLLFSSIRVENLTVPSSEISTCGRQFMKYSFNFCHGLPAYQRVYGLDAPPIERRFRPGGRREPLHPFAVRQRRALASYCSNS